jgi:hypothetical protein
MVSVRPIARFLKKLHTCICRVQFHRLEALVLFKWRAGPFPDSTHFALTSKLIAICGHGDRMPMLETNIGTCKVGEELLRALAVLQSS